MNGFEMVHLGGVFCPKFNEQGDTKDEVAVPGVNTDIVLQQGTPA